MKKTKHIIILFILLLIGVSSVSAQSRRPIDNKHPMWLIHVDVWNNANPQNVIDLIPDDIKPYVVLNLSLSCAYDKEKNVHTRPQNAILTYESWASVCCANNMWFTCQPASGGHTHIRDDAEHFQEALDIHESFFKKYPNFLGWNYAEQFWGFGEPGDAYSSKENDRLNLFSKLVPMHHKYGGFLTISYCGSIYHQNLNPIAMLTRNSELYNACKQYPEACIWLYKYTHSGCYYSNESTTIAPFISGLAQNYGVRYDNCGFNEGVDAVAKQLGWKGTYPNALGFGTVMEQMCINGGAVWDGPELIWREECFIGDNDYVDGEGYRVRRLKRSPSMNNGWVELFRKVIDGTIAVPTRDEVVKDTKIAIVNNDNQYNPPYNFYSGIYKQTDPMNLGDGDGYDNRWFLKSTGRYRTVPYLLPSDVPSSISIKKNYTDIESWSGKTNDFNNQYAEVSSGDLFVARRNNLLVTYYPYSYYNEKTTASAVIPLKYNTCESVELQYGRFGNGIVQEYGDYVDLYLNNYCQHSRSGRGENNPDVVTEKIIIRGAKERPSVGWYNKTRTSDAGAIVDNYTETWENGVYTLSVPHNGAVEIRINCKGYATGRQQAPSRASLSASNIAKPELSAYNGPLVIEAEDMLTKNVKHLVILPYFSGELSEWYPEVTGHAGLGFVNMGKSGASLKNVVTKLKTSGIYKIGIKYTADKGAAALNVKINGETRQIKLSKTNYNEWQTAEIIANLNAGENTIYYTNADDSEFYIDNVTYRLYGSDEEEAEKSFSYVMNCESEGGFPAGWKADDNGTVQEYNQTYGGGPRTFKNGCTPAVIYWRSSGNGKDDVGTLSYGEQENYRLHLKPGTYSAEFVNYYWYDATTSKYTLEISSLAGDSIAKTSEIGAIANPNGDQKRGTFDISQKQTLNFTITKEGDYVAKFTTRGFWKAYVLAYFKITGSYKESSSQPSSPSTPTTQTVLSAYPGSMHPLTKDDYKNWDDEQADWSTLRLGKTINPGGLIFGDAQSSFQNYLDVSLFDRIYIEGTPGAIVQLRYDSYSEKNNNGKDVNAGYKTANIAIGSTGTTEYDLSGITKLNTILLAANSSSATIKNIKLRNGTEASATKSLNDYKYGTYTGPNGTLQSEASNSLVLNKLTNTIFGDGSVPNNRYTVLNGVLRMNFHASTGDSGKTVRILFNRNVNNDYTELTAIIDSDGKASIDLSQYSSIHLNAVKMPPGVEATFSSVTVVDGTLYKDTPLSTECTNATFTKSNSVCEMHLGTELNSGNILYGDTNVPHLAYADISGYDKVFMTGTPNKKVRLLFNRKIVEGPVVEKEASFATDGTAIVDLSDIKEYAHLHAIKVQWGNDATTVNSISLYSDAKSDEYINYYLYGANTMDEAATSALNDPNACVIDIKLLNSNGKTTLVGKNPNCLYVTDTTDKVSNTKNIISETGNIHTSAEIELVDGFPYRSPFDVTTPNGKSSYTRNLTTEWGTIALPFELNLADCNTEVYILRKASEAGFSFSVPKDETVPAGTIILYHKAESGNTVLKGKNLIATPSGLNITPTGISDWYTAQSFTHRVIEDVNTDPELQGYDVYGISNDEFVHATKKVTLNPFRAFFLHAKSANAPMRFAINLTEDNDDFESTSIVSTSTAINKIVHYNAAGQRIDSGSHGIHIIRMNDGTIKKVLIK